MKFKYHANGLPNLASIPGLMEHDIGPLNLAIQRVSKNSVSSKEMREHLWLCWVGNYCNPINMEATLVKDFVCSACQHRMRLLSNDTRDNTGFCRAVNFKEREDVQ